MPTILRIRGYRFYFYALEGTEAPHAHIDKGAGTPKVWLTDLSVAYSEGLKVGEIRTALRLARKYPVSLVKAWHEFRDAKVKAKSRKGSC